MVDSVYWIAVKYSRDRWHEAAIGLVPLVEDAAELFITEGVLVETINFLLRKVSAAVAYQVAEALLTDPSIQVLDSNAVARVATLAIMRTYPQLSFTDANIVFHMQQLGVASVLSFDAGFDGIPGITRLH